MHKLLRKIKTFIYTFIAKRKISSYRAPLYVNNKSTFNNKTYLGKNVHFNGMWIGGCGRVDIGDNFHSGRECMMMTHNHNYEGVTIPYDCDYICKDIVIEDNVWIGNRVIILGGVIIGEGAIIQAGSVVVSDIPKYAIAGGHPASVFSSRNVDHYIELKELGKFH